MRPLKGAVEQVKCAFSPQNGQLVSLQISEVWQLGLRQNRYMGLPCLHLSSGWVTLSPSSMASNLASLMI